MSGWERWAWVDASRQRLIFRIVNACLDGTTAAKPARRRVIDFVALGWAERWEDGFRVTVARMQRPESLAAGVVFSQRFLILLAGLRQLGLVGQGRAAASA